MWEGRPAIAGGVVGGVCLPTTAAVDEISSAQFSAGEIVRSVRNR